MDSPLDIIGLFSLHFAETLQYLDASEIVKKRGSPMLDLAILNFARVRGDEDLLIEAVGANWEELVYAIISSGRFKGRSIKPTISTTHYRSMLLMDEARSYDVSCRDMTNFRMCEVFDSLYSLVSWTLLERCHPYESKRWVFYHIDPIKIRIMEILAYGRPITHLPKKLRSPYASKEEKKTVEGPISYRPLIRLSPLAYDFEKLIDHLYNAYTTLNDDKHYYLVRHIMKMIMDICRIPIPIVEPYVEMVKNGFVDLPEVERKFWSANLSYDPNETIDYDFLRMIGTFKFIVYMLIAPKKINRLTWFIATRIFDKFLQVTGWLDNDSVHSIGERNVDEKEYIDFVFCSLSSRVEPPLEGTDCPAWFIPRFGRYFHVQTMAFGYMLDDRQYFINNVIPPILDAFEHIPVNAKLAYELISFFYFPSEIDKKRHSISYFDTTEVKDVFVRFYRMVIEQHNKLGLRINFEAVLRSMAYFTMDDIVIDEYVGLPISVNVDPNRHSFRSFIHNRDRFIFDPIKVDSFPVLNIMIEEDALDHIAVKEPDGRHITESAIDKTLDYSMSKNIWALHQWLEKNDRSLFIYLRKKFLKIERRYWDRYMIMISLSIDDPFTSIRSYMSMLEHCDQKAVHLIKPILSRIRMKHYLGGGLKFDWVEKSESLRTKTLPQAYDYELFSVVEPSAFPAFVDIVATKFMDMSFVPMRAKTIASLFRRITSWPFNLPDGCWNDMDQRARQCIITLCSSPLVRSHPNLDRLIEDAERIGADASIFRSTA